MQVDVAGRERRRERRLRVNRAHVRAFLDGVRNGESADEMPAPADARRMRPYVFGQNDEVTA